MTYLLLFLAGALLCNAIPHLVSGVRGDPFPTPFAKPPGKGNSPPVTNFLWGSANLAGGLALLSWRIGTVDPTGERAALAVGFLLLGLFCARHFGKVRQR